jgi:1-acyl-sn-glycerol-3-phosphate acyltransferase
MGVALSVLRVFAPLCLILLRFSPITGDMRSLTVFPSPVTDANATAAREEERPSIQFLHRLVNLYVGGYHKVDVASPCQLPQTGPAILVCNHVSSLDPMLLQWACPRLIVWMMAREYYLPGTRWLFDVIRTIPVERSRRDMAATRAAMRALEQGHVLGIFPEGRLAADRKIGQFQTGVAMMALRSGVGVYPASVDGTMRDQGMLEAFLFGQRAKIAFGGRVPLEMGDVSHPAIERATRQIQQAVCDLNKRLQ